MAIPYPKVPLYDLTLPVSKKTVSYRPFLVKEEKILLMANETESEQREMINAIRQVLTECTMGKLDIDKLPVADVEFLFVKVRSKSIGDIIESTVTCQACGNKIEYPINIQKIEMFNEVKDRNVDLGDGIIVTMNFPTVMTTDDMTGVPEIDIPLHIVGNMVEMITMNDETFPAADFTKAEMIDWLNHLSQTQLEKLNEFLEKLPKIVYADKIKCTCGQEITIYMEGLESFFGR
jgi:hypothetical protein